MNDAQYEEFLTRELAFSRALHRYQWGIEYEKMVSSATIPPGFFHDFVSRYHRITLLSRALGITREEMIGEHIKALKRSFHTLRDFSK